MRPPRGAVGLLAALVLVACSSGAADEPQPTTSAPAATSKAPTPTATESTPAPPEMPPEAREGTPEGAEAFARYYFELVNYAYETGDTAPMRSVSNVDCGNCSQIADAVDEHVARGGRYAGGRVQVISSQAQPPDSSGIALVTVVFNQEPLAAVNADGTTDDTGDGAANQPVEFYAEWNGAAWTVFGYALES